jgi:nucleoside transporter
MPATPLRAKIHLCAMTFLQFAILGVWSVPLVTYLQKAGYTAPQIALAYTTLAWAAILAPLLVGMVADRFFASERILAVLNLLGGVLLGLAALAATAPDGTPRPVLFFWVLLAHCTCYMPTWSLTSSISLAHVADATREFPVIRVMGSLGWIAVSAVSLFSSFYGWAIEETAWPLWVGAGLCLVAGVYNFFLPHTPPPAAGKKVTLGDVLGRKALGLLLDRNFAVLVACSCLIMVPASFFWTFAADCFDEKHMAAVQFKMSICQMSDLVFMGFLSFFLHRLGMKTVFLIGLLAWVARYVLLAYGNMESSLWMYYLALMVHGMCFAFLFVVGPMYADRKAPKDLQASAQGLLTLLTFGLGQLVGTYLSGEFVDFYAVKNAAGEVTHDWQPIWLWAAAMSAVIAAAFFWLFRDKVGLRAEVVDGDAGQARVKQPGG